jgi:hypothetical protein
MPPSRACFAPEIRLVFASKTAVFRQNFSDFRVKSPEIFSISGRPQHTPAEREALDCGRDFRGGHRIAEPRAERT